MAKGGARTWYFPDGYLPEKVENGPVEARVRIMAFGDGKPGERGRYRVISLAHAARFLRNHLRRYRAMLAPVEHSDETLELLHLLDKLS